VEAECGPINAAAICHYDLIGGAPGRQGEGQGTGGIQRWHDHGQQGCLSL